MAPNHATIFAAGRLWVATSQVGADSQDLGSASSILLKEFAQGRDAAQLPRPDIEESMLRQKATSL